MKKNKLRHLLNNNLPSTSTRIWSTWPFMTEAVGSTGNYDYIEFVAEYAPFSQYDLENIARAAELSDMGTMIKVDFQNREYVAQKAVASGFQAILFTDIKTPDEVYQSVNAMKSDTPESGGRFGCPIRRFIGFQPNLSQLDHSKRQNEIVIAVMIEKVQAMDNIEEICSIPGVDMVQFGPTDYSMSRGWNKLEHKEEYKEAERKMIEVALKHGVQPRCDISMPDEAKYYIDLGVKHFSLGDEFRYNYMHWNQDGAKIREIADSLK